MDFVGAISMSDACTEGVTAAAPASSQATLITLRLTWSLSSLPSAAVAVSIERFAAGGDCAAAAASELAVAPPEVQLTCMSGKLAFMPLATACKQVQVQKGK